MIVDHQFVSQNVFFPRLSVAPPTLVVDVPDARLACFLCHQHPEAGTMLYFHGNGELAADCANNFAKRFLSMGVNICFVEYRGYGASTGTPALGAMLPDGERIVQALGIPPQRIVAFGRSLGRVYAIELARRLPQLAGIVLESAIADITEALKPMVNDVNHLSCTEQDFMVEINTHFNLKATLQNYPGALLVLHAAQDHLLDQSHAERLCTWAAGSNKKLVVFPEGNHNTILITNYKAYMNEVEAFLKQIGIV